MCDSTQVRGKNEEGKYKKRNRMYVFYNIKLGYSYVQGVCDCVAATYTRLSLDFNII